MEFVGASLIALSVILLIVAFLTDEGAFALFGVIFATLGVLILLPEPTSDDIITAQEIEYAVNKCSSFGGLKEFRSDVIICMDKTEINMNFEPEKKVEAE